MTHPNTRYLSTRAPSWRALLLGGLLAVGLVATASAATWNNPAGGAWSNPANWTPADVPDAAGESALLPALSGAYEVTLDISPAVDAIQIDAGGPTLDLNGSSIGKAMLVSNSGTIRNFVGAYNSDRIRNLKGGTVVAGGTIQPAATDLWNAGTILAAGTISVDASLMLHGGGTLVLRETAMKFAQYGPVLSIGKGTTLRGSGAIEMDVDRPAAVDALWGQVLNSGVLEADGTEGVRIQVHALLKNSGTIRVINGGTLNVNRPLVQSFGGTIKSGPGGGTFSILSSGSGSNVPGTLSHLRSSGRVEADGGDLTLHCGTMLEGVIERGPGGGAVYVEEAVLQNVTVAAGAEMATTATPYGYFCALASGTRLKNYGIVRVKGLALFGGSASNPVYLGGTGTMILEGGSLGNGYGGFLVNEAGSTISGCGTINLTLINEGTVDLDCGSVPASRPGRIPGSIVNRGRLRVSGGAVSVGGARTVLSNRGTISVARGALTLDNGATLDNTGGGILSTDGGTVYLGGASGATVIGGRLEAAGGARGRRADGMADSRGIDVPAGSFRVDRAVTLRDVTLGPAASLVTAAGAITTVSGARFVNEGTNRIAGALVVSPGTAYAQTSGATVMEEGGTVSGLRRPVASPTAASVPATLRFYARQEARGASFVLELPHAAQLNGRVYDAAGREVARLADGVREAGVHVFALGRAAAGLPGGIYFGRMILTAQGASEVLQAKVAVLP